METNNNFNYGTHAVPTNSGLKHSSGESLFTNGSSMSFPQQGKSEHLFALLFYISSNAQSVHAVTLTQMSDQCVVLRFMG